MRGFISTLKLQNMKFLSLEYIKQHSRIDYDCEDGLLEMYGDSAEDTLAQYLNRGNDAGEMIESLIEQYGKIPAPLYHACLMLVDISYQYRSPISPTSVNLVPYTFDILVKPFMKL